MTKNACHVSYGNVLLTFQPSVLLGHTLRNTIIQFSVAFTISLAVGRIQEDPYTMQASLSKVESDD